MTRNIQGFRIALHNTIRDAVACIERSGKGIALVINPDGTLHATITDGDVRRAMLASMSLDMPVSELLKRIVGLSRQPVTAPADTDRDMLLQTMRERFIRHMPLVDGRGCVTGLVTLDELVPDHMLPLQAVIMAGGKGTRLRPLTEEMPKPMLMVGDRPLLEHIVDQLREAGIRQVSVSTGYRSEKIKRHFGNGQAFGVDLSYVDESEPLGTAGSLSLVRPSEEPILVINGDILTKIDFRSMLVYHRESHADMTVAVRRYEVSVPFGVIEADSEACVCSLIEKPIYAFLVNAGIYLIEPRVRDLVPAGVRFDMTDLIKRLLERNRRVVSFPVLEYWLDVGMPTDYERAKQDVKTGRYSRE